MASRPDVSDARTAGAGGPVGDGATCVKAPVDPKGCAKPDVPNPSTCLSITGGDEDCDGLYRPGFGQIYADQVETFYRTQNIGVGFDLAMANDIEACPAGLCAVAACGPDGLIGSINDKDSDCDGLQDGVEVKVYGTSPANPDTDDDGCGDGREAADVNGDRTVSSADLGITAAAFGPYALMSGVPLGLNGMVDVTRLNKDFNKDKTISSADLGQVAALFGPCSSAFSNQQQGNTPITAFKPAPAN
jgi:hypothetical protein